MTPSQLKAKYLTHNPEGHYFSHENMKFSGDTMANYGVREIAEAGCYELYRKKPVKGKMQESRYFDSKTFESKNGAAYLVHLAEKNKTEEAIAFFTIASTKPKRERINDDSVLNWAIAEAKNHGNQKLVDFFSSKLSNTGVIADFLNENKAQNLTQNLN